MTSENFNKTTAADMIEFWHLNFIANPILNMSPLEAQKISDTMYWYWVNAGIEYDELLEDYSAFDGTTACPRCPQQHPCRRELLQLQQPLL